MRKNKAYKLKVYPAGMSREVYRVIEICGKETLDTLCAAIMDAFDFQNLITTPEMKSGDEISGRGGQMNGLATNVWNVTFNQPVNDAIDFAKKMREEEQYGLIGGGNLAY